jgi:hypothetical protein
MVKAAMIHHMNVPIDDIDRARGTLDDIAKHLETAAVPYARGKAGLPQIFCEDPAGNLVELNTGWTQQPLR